MSEQPSLFQSAPAPIDRAAVSLADALATAKWWAGFAAELAEAALPAALTFPRALAVVGAVMLKGRAAHPGDDWRQRDAAEHLAHARAHLEALAAGDRNEDHLAHAATRLLMALEVQSRDEK